MDKQVYFILKNAFNYYDESLKLEPDKDHFQHTLDILLSDLISAGYDIQKENK